MAKTVENYKKSKKKNKMCLGATVFYYTSEEFPTVTCFEIHFTI